MSHGDEGDGSRTAENQVVVGVDGSYTAIGAARWAAAVAVKLDAALHIVHARAPVEHNLSDAGAYLRAADMEAEHESATAILKSAKHAAEADHDNLQIITSEVERHADEALTELSRTARLIVLGSDEISLGTAIMVGSTTLSVATHSTCPVVAWRGEVSAPTSQPIVLGIDHDHDSRVAVTAAFEFAHRLGVGIIAVHTWSTRRPAGDVSIPFLIDWKQLEDDERQHLSDSIAPLIKLYPDVAVTQIVDLDGPSRALLRRAKAAQLIVVGSRGRGLLSSALLGSTGLNLLHHSTIPVMICRSSEGHDG
ncbi:universal stress protein [Mycobacterium sp. 3519A]|uniref:universal stress protein n=1 Tax=Mycobacterium sp. 3519A TaxID=2057184 RepID=UPI000C7DA9E5|nr:universal stress protein [Mycobacterium sp. 3519A]